MLAITVLTKTRPKSIAFIPWGPKVSASNFMVSYSKGVQIVWTKVVEQLLKWVRVRESVCCFFFGPSFQISV